MTSHGKDIIEFTKELIQIPTVNPPGEHYEECILVLEKKCDQLGLETSIINCDGLPAIIGGGGRGILHFHAHYDVVYADESQFHPFIKKGMLYGRGSSDMKGGLAAMLYAISSMDSPDITFSITADEETGGVHGVNCLLKKGLLSPRAVVMPEVSSNQIWNGCRGAFVAEIRVRGESAHSVYQKRGSNAFIDMIDVVQHFRNIDPGKGSLLVGGAITGGSQFNMVPESCSFTIDWRFPPEETLSHIRKRVDEVIEKAKEGGIRMEYVILLETEGFYTNPEEEICNVMEKAVNEIRGSSVMEICPGFLDIRYFAFQGVPALAYGPGLLEYAHGPHEYIRIKDLTDAAAIYELCAKKILRNSP
ncbi:MAG: ArgE/DapE family deacylase [Theionarchaea archaeon]|nr:ArgE/DapE family deacylase [Theionarchaea archaeon]